MGKVTNIFKKYLISTNFHDLSMTSKYMLTRNYHNKSALSSVLQDFGVIKFATCV